MKKLICQLWKRRNNDDENIVEGYSLHLNDKQRLLFLNKNFSRLSGSKGNLSVKSYYPCEVKDDVYENVIKKQFKHGLMVESVAPPSHDAATEENLPLRSRKNITLQFSEVKRILSELSLERDYRKVKYEFVNTETETEDTEGSN